MSLSLPSFFYHSCPSIDPHIRRQYHSYPPSVRLSILSSHSLSIAFRMSVDGVNGCKFCEIARTKSELHLRESERCVVVRDIKPKAPQHFLVIPKIHINKPTDLTPADLDLLREMEKLGREYLRLELKDKGEADTVEDMLRIGFHWPPMIRVNHLHLHVLYPIKDLGFFSKLLTFRPGKVFKPLSQVIYDLEKKKEEK